MISYVMSTSLLKKSLRLFEEKSEKVSKSKAHNQSRKSNKVAKTQKKQPTLKDRKIKSALDAYAKKHPNEDKTEDNLAILLKLSQKKKLDKAATDKVIELTTLFIFHIPLPINCFQILSYHLQKHRKVVEVEPQKKKEGTVFTDEDFLKFEQEYFVK